MSVSSANSQFGMFLTASAWSSFSSLNFCRQNCLMTSHLVCCASILQGKQLPSSLNKTHMHISVSEFVVPLFVGHQIVQPCTDL